MEVALEILEKCDAIYKNQNNKKFVQQGGFASLLFGAFSTIMGVISGIAGGLVQVIPRLITPPVFYKENTDTGKKEFTFPYYPDYLNGYGLLWKFLYHCIKISMFIVVGIYGGISLVFMGVLYLFNRLFSELTNIVVDSKI